MVRVAVAGAVFFVGLSHAAGRGLSDAACSDTTPRTTASLIQRLTEKSPQRSAEGEADLWLGQPSTQVLRETSGGTPPSPTTQDAAHIVYTVSHDVLDATLRSMLSLSRHHEASNVVIHMLAPEPDVPEVERLGRCFRQQLSAANLSRGVPALEVVSLREMPFELDYSYRPALEQGREAAQARLFLGEYLPQAHRVLYLDSDTIVLRDVSPLLALQMNTPLAAAPDPKNISRAFGFFCPTIGTHVDASKRGFNSGVMLMNLDRWRAENITTSIMKKAEKIDCPKCDQMMLNIEFQSRGDGGFDLLSPEWNKFTAVGNMDENFSENILHFTGSRKPWDDHLDQFLERFREEWAPAGSVNNDGDCAGFVL